MGLLSALSRLLIGSGNCIAWLMKKLCGIWNRPVTTESTVPVTTNRHIVCSDGVIIEVPTVEGVWQSETKKDRFCLKCGAVWHITGTDWKEISAKLKVFECAECGADIEGVVHPKKRATPREIKTVEITDNPELDTSITQALANNPKALADYREGKKAAVGFLVGQVMKTTKANPAEVKARLEKALGG